MKIQSLTAPIKSKIQRTAKILLTTALITIPAKCGVDKFVKESEVLLPNVEQVINRHIVEGLNIEKSVNCRGGITYSYDSVSLEKLSKLFQKANIHKTYTFPIDTALHPYIPSTGQFGSIRPYGRAHLGIDIYPRLYGRKPTQPVPVLSATDGIVVSVKQSPVKDPDNLIANNIKIMAPDGKIYTYDHLGRPEDYPNKQYTKLKTLGTIIRVGDTIGTVGKTGETQVWHLHLSVQDLKERTEQLQNPTWLKLFKKHGVYATPCGQIDPLNNEKAKGIANYLNQYKIDKGEKVDYVSDL